MRSYAICLVPIFWVQPNSLPSSLEGAIKGQLISKGLFGILNSTKKRTKKFDFTTMIPQVDLFSFVFLEEFEDTKKTFRN